MKIRTGFVSNSSSSSFVVMDKMTTAELAMKMIEIIESDYREYGEGSVYYDKAMSWLKENQDFDNAIVIPWSCNYDTWIKRSDRGIQVYTCNNHCWYDEIDYISPGGGKDEEDIPYDGNDPVFDLTTMEYVAYKDYKDLWTRNRSKKEA